MTENERKLLMFLARTLQGELSEWSYRPSNGEIRQTLETLVGEVVNEWETEKNDERS